MRKTLKKLSRTLRIPFNRAAAFRRLKAYQSEPRNLEETVKWAMSFGGSGYFRVRTLQISSEITALARAVAALKPKIILEIGTSRGGTLLIWASLASERVITCDLEHYDAQRPLLQALPPPGSKCEVVLLTGNSHEATFKERVKQALNGQKADFLFIDGDHTEPGVTADYRDYREFVRPGGLIGFHDIVESQPLPTNQVYHLWKNVRKEAVTEEFVNDPKQCGFGIGIVRVPA